MANGESKIDDELLNIFIEEATDLINTISLNFIKWKEDLSNLEYISQLKRDLHTLKGSARMVGKTNIGKLAHEIETALDYFIQEKTSISPDNYELIFLAYDRLSIMIEAIKKNEHAEFPEEVIQRLKAAIGLEDISEKGTREQALDKEFISPQIEPKQKAVTLDKKKLSEAQDIVRVRSDLLDKLNRLSIDSSMSRIGLEQQLKMIGLYLQEMREGARRLSEQVQAIEREFHSFIQEDLKKIKITTNEGYDFLEKDKYTTVGQMASGIRETALDIENMIKAMNESRTLMDSLLANEARANIELQNRLSDTKLVPFESIVPRLSRITRQIAQELNKKVNFKVAHVEGEMDRTALEHLIPSLEHLLRNAIDHGIESEEERIKKGKSPTGNIQLGFYRSGTMVSIEITDDGQGLNFAKIKEKAIHLGLVAKEKVLDEQELTRLILEPGFSTKDKISEISGRGVGLDVVNAAIYEMGGSLTILSYPSEGTKFILRFPFTASLNRILMFKIQDKIFGVILSQIIGVVRVEKEKLTNLLQKNKATFQHDHKPYYLHYLGSLLEMEKTSFQIPKKKNYPVILYPSKEYPMALLVDEMLYSREQVIQSLGIQFKLFNECSGATLLGDGSVVLIIDPYALSMKARAQMKREMKSIEFSKLRKVNTVRKPIIMVVDDSLTIRTVTNRFLERHQYQVILAKDGLEALHQLESQIPDIILLDIDMPRMDGFEFATSIRNDERFRHIPIIVITSRPSEKHRQKASEMLLEGFVEKPYQESELLDQIEKLLGK